MTKQYADLILELSNSRIDRVFTYRVPQDMHDLVYVGCPVFVYFGTIRKKIKAYIIALKEEIDFPESRLRDILSIIEPDMAADKNLLALAAYIKKKYGVSFARAISTVMPVKNKTKKRNKEKQNIFLEKDTRSKELLPEQLNVEQELAYQSFCADYERGENAVYLLHGVTGSGKTLLYMHMIKRVLAEGKQAIVLVPEISLTYQTVQRFRAFFGDRLAVLNSRLSKGERTEQFERVLSGEASIMIGPRSALFTPFPRLGLIVVDEEHDGAYKNEGVPRYDARDLARAYAEICGASLLLSSATPTPESYRKALRKEYKLLELSYRAAENARMPRIHLVDLREELEQGNKGIFSRKLQDLIQDRLQKKEQIMLFMNRRGMSNFVSCRSCGEVIKCPHCDVSLTLHNNQRLYCHYCNFGMDMPSLCPACRSPYIAGFGVGTQKLELLTRKMFPTARVLRLDQDNSRAKAESLDILKAFAAQEADILIGTQMIVKGHDFAKVSLVGIVAADTSLYVNDYTSAQRTYELLTQASGRAGRAQIQGEVLIQTYNPEHYALQACIRQDYAYYYQQEISFRRLAMYPPIVHILGIQLSAKNEEILDEALEIYQSTLEKHMPRDKKTDLVGPVVPAVYKLRDYFRKIIYIKAHEYDILTQIKEETELSIEGLRLFEQVSILYDLV